LLRSVSVSSPYLSEGIRFEHLTAGQSLLRFDLRANHFESELGALAKTRSFQLDASYFLPPRAWGRRLSLGATFALDDRFEKASHRSVELTRGFSLGPSLLFGTRATRISLAVPLTGIFSSGTLGGAYGAKLALERRFLFSRAGGWTPDEIVVEGSASA